MNHKKGVYKNDGPYDAYVDLAGVTELTRTSQSTPLIVGGAVTLTNFQQLLFSAGSANPDYWYAPILAEHIGKIASVPVRNVSGFLLNTLQSTQIISYNPEPLNLI